MMNQIEDVAENDELIEVEIFNGASEDIIWQNAHPEYKDEAKQFQADRDKNRAEGLNWGRMPASMEGDGEVWEDELGSFKADLYDNCSSRDKYLALHKG
jgi:hypothetical protein